MAAGERPRGVAGGVASGVRTGVAPGVRWYRGELGRALVASEPRAEDQDFGTEARLLRGPGVDTGETSRLRMGVRGGVAVCDRAGVAARGPRCVRALGVSERSIRCRTGVAERARLSCTGQSKGLAVL